VTARFRLRRQRPPIAEWRPERGPGYDLRQYLNGEPTGLVATTAWRAPGDARPAAQEIPGIGVVLIVEQCWITVAERCAPRRTGVWLRLPLRSCVGAQLLDEPGLPGSALVRVTLTVRIGENGTAVPLWFAVEQRPELLRFVDRLRGGTGPPAPPSPPAAPPLPPLEVDQAPDTDDWVVFRPHRTSDEVLRLRPADEFLTRQAEEAR
jgi:hypothetical protein